MNIDPVTLYKLIAAIGVFSVVIAAIVSGIIQGISAWRERKAADRRHLRELAFRAALTQWQHDVAQAAIANRQLVFGQRPTQLGEVHFDMILVKKLKLVDVFNKRHISEKSISKGVREMGRIQDAITREFTAIQTQHLQAAEAAKAQQEQQRSDPNQKPLALNS